MTNKLVAFTFQIDNWNDPKPVVTRVTEGGRHVNRDITKKVSPVMTDRIKALLPALKNPKNEYSSDYKVKCKKTYECLTRCDQFTVEMRTNAQFTALMPAKDNKFTILIKYGAGAEIEAPLKEETVNSLNRCLATATTPPPVSKNIRANQSTPPESHGILYHIFAAIIRCFRYLFFRESNGPRYQPLEQKTYGTFPSTHDAPVDGVCPLQNGNSICFINAVFQALMNTPELIPVLTEAHEDKIREQEASLAATEERIAENEAEAAALEHRMAALTKNYSWFSYLLPDPNYDALRAEKQIVLNRLLDNQRQREALKKLIKASQTLIQAFGAYNKGSPIWLNDLRGLDQNFGSSSQEDACQFLETLFQPLKTELLPLFGEEDLLEPKENESEKDEQELNRRQDVSPLPANNLLRRLEPTPIVRMEIPQDTIELQALLDQKFTLSDTSSEEDKMSFQSEGKKGWYRIAKKRLVIETQDQKAPDFIPLQLKRFRITDQTLSKAATPIVLPKDNNVITVTVNNKRVAYAIHTIVLHRDDSLEKGHYFSYVRKEKGWVEANDSNVHRLTELPDSAAKEAYIMFLKRVPESIPTQA